MNSNQDEYVGEKEINFFEELLPKIIHLRARFEDCQKLTTSIAICCICLSTKVLKVREFFFVVVAFQQTFTTFTFKILNQFVGQCLLSLNGQIIWSTLHYFQRQIVRL